MMMNDERNLYIMRTFLKHMRCVPLLNFVFLFSSPGVRVFSSYRCNEVCTCVVSWFGLNSSLAAAPSHMTANETVHTLMLRIWLWWYQWYDYDMSVMIWVYNGLILLVMIWSRWSPRAGVDPSWSSSSSLKQLWQLTQACHRECPNLPPAAGLRPAWQCLRDAKEKCVRRLK